MSTFIDAIKPLIYAGAFVALVICIAAEMCRAVNEEIEIASKKKRKK